MSIAEVMQVLVEHGHSIDNIKNGYTIAQVYLFFEKIRKRELDDYRMNAMVLTNCLIYSNPTSEQGTARKKAQMFQQFMDSLNWGRLTKKDKERKEPKTAETVIKSLFGGAGLIPMRKGEKKRVS